MDGDLKKKGVRRPMNAFLIFCKRHRSKEREKNPELDNRSITRILGDKWAKLEPEKKAFFNNLAKENKDAFMKANPNYKWHSADKSHGSAKSAATSAPVSASSRKPLPQISSSDTNPSHSKPSGKLTSPSVSESSKLLAGGLTASLEHNSALLQLAEMCTSELYSSVPEKTTTLTSQTRLSSPLPPPKKRARQWSLDNPEGSLNPEAPQKSDPQSRKSSKPVSGNKKVEAPSGPKKSRNEFRNIHSAMQSQEEYSNTSLKLDKKQNDSLTIKQFSQSPPSHAKSQAMPFPPLCKNQTSGPIAGQIHPIPLRGEGQEPLGSCPNQSLPHPGSVTPFFYHDTLGAASEAVPYSAHQAGRDIPERVLDFSHYSAKHVETTKPDSLCEKKHDNISLSLPTEGKIASLLSSSHPLVGYESGLLKTDNANRKIQSFDSTSLSPQPIVNDKLGLRDLKTCSNYPVSDANFSSNVSQSFTEGKVKKKWTQRMMVEAKKEEDQARQVTSKADISCPITQGLAPPPVPVTLKTSDFCSTPTDFPSDKSSLFIAKPEIKSEPPSVFSDGLISKNPLPKDYTFHSLNTTNSSSSFYKDSKPEALQSNTLYRALMGQTPSPFSMSTYASKTSVTTPAPTNFSGSSFGTFPTKVEEDKKIFTPIAACGKKIMDHIVERLFQTGFSGETKGAESGQKAKAEPAPSHFLDDSSVCLKPPPPVKNSVVDLQAAFSFPVRSAQNLVEKIVTEMCQAPADQEISYNDGDNYIKKELETSVSQGGNGSLVKHQNKQSLEDKNMGKDNSSEGLSSTTISNEQNEMPSEVAEDSNSADLDDSMYQPVRKSRRANRGQKYQALIKEGIIQPSKERLAARNAERNVRSCSSKDDLEKSEPKKILKRTFSDRDVPPASATSDTPAPKTDETCIPEPSKEFNLEKEIASLPTCSFDQFEKKKTLQNRRHSESMFKKADAKGSQSHLPKACGSTNSVKKEVIVKNGCGTASSYQAASLKELGCFTVSIPHVKEELPTESLTGSRKRKARRHCITRISVAPIQENAKVNSEKPIGPKVACAADVSDRIGSNDPMACQNSSESGKTGGRNPFFTNSKGPCDGEDSLAPKVTPVSSQLKDGHARKSPQPSQHSFPALTLLSSVMIDSEKAISPACQSRAPPITQSPTPAALAKPWPLNGVQTLPTAAKSSSMQPTPVSHVALSAGPIPPETTQLAKWMASFPACLQMPSGLEKTSPSLPSPTPLSSVASNTKPFPHASPMPVISAPALSSVISTMPPMKALHAPPVTTAVSMPSSSSITMQNSLNGTQGSYTIQKPIISSVLSPYVISTLTASKTTESTPCPWPKPLHNVALKRKKTSKSATDDKHKPNLDVVSSMGPKSLEPGTKKLVKLLLKGEGDSESALNSGMDASGQTQSMESKQGVAKPCHKPQDQVQPGNRQASKGIKGGGRKGGHQTFQQKTCSSPQYLSLKTQLKAGQILASNQFADPSAKKHKPTIWDHLNSPGCLPIKSTKFSPNTAPPFKKRSQESSPPPQSSLPVGCLPKGQRVATGTSKSSNRDSVGSDTESASEETEDHVSSDTDSAEESEIGVASSTAVKAVAHTTTIVSSCSNVSKPTATCNPSASLNMFMAKENEQGRTVPNPPMTLSSQIPLPSRDVPPPLSKFQPAGTSTSLASISDVNEGQSSSLQMRNVSTPKSSSNVLRSSSSAVTLTASSAHLSMHPGDMTPAASITRPAAVSTGNSQPTPCSSSPAVYMPVIVSASDSTRASEDVSETVSTPGRFVTSSTHSTPPPPPVSRIPIIPSFPSSSTTMDPGMCDARASSSRLDGNTVHVSTPPHLPGSPSVAVVQS